MVDGNSHKVPEVELCSWFRWGSRATVSLPREYWGKITCLQRLWAILPTIHVPSRCMWSCVLPYALVSHQSTILLQHSLPCVDPCAWLPQLNDAYVSLCLLPFLVPLASVKHLFIFCTCFCSPLSLWFPPSFLVQTYSTDSLNIDCCLLLHNTKGLLTLLKK